MRTSSGERRGGSGVAAVAALAALTGCGSTAASDNPVNAVTPAPPSTPGPKVIRNNLAQGVLADPVAISAAAPSQLTVQEVTIQPGGVVPWHLHPGTENTVLTSGQLSLTVAGVQSCTPRTVGPGQAFDIPANTPHTARNDGTAAVVLFVTYMGNKPGAALVQPVPKPSGC